jgi:hypothetical protein
MHLPMQILTAAPQGDMPATQGGQRSHEAVQLVVLIEAVATGALYRPQGTAEHALSQKSVAESVRRIA